MQDKIEQDIKVALKAGDRRTVDVLRFLKSALQNEAIAQKGDLSDESAIKVLKKEAKKREEAAQLYEQSGNQDRANAEREEKVIIEKYLPVQMDEAAIAEVVDEVLAGIENPNMGQVMGQVMQKVGSKADGGTVSRIVKEKLN